MLAIMQNNWTMGGVWLLKRTRLALYYCSHSVQRIGKGVWYQKPDQRFRELTLYKQFISMNAFRALNTHYKQQHKIKIHLNKFSI